ncbi:MAG: S1 RNA-binding domain-containing protein [Myxococcales bacterium]|nr:S1 RNA-binding domain-containing protein [Myxococcales bacterium]
MGSQTPEYEEHDEDFAALFAASGGAPARGGSTLRAGAMVDGVVIQIGADLIFVDIGSKSEARIARSELTDARGQLTVGIGDRIRATVKDPRGPELVMGLGGGRGVDVAAVEIAHESGTPITGNVTRTVKAGLEVQIGGVRAFCPASQAELGYVKELDHLVGQDLQFKVVEIRDGGRSVVVSRKAVLADERAHQARALRERLEVGAELDGTVQSIQPYGAFIDLGGLEGLVHISQMGHGRVERVEDVVSIGEVVKVRVLSIEAREGNPDEVRVSLSMKTEQAPQAALPAPDEVVDGTVAQVGVHGVFVDTPIGRGLVPQRELGLAPGADPKRAYPMGAAVRVVLLSRDSSGKLRFSVRGVADAEARTAYRSFTREQKQQGKGLGSLGDLLRDKLPETLPEKSGGRKAKPKGPASKAAPKAEAPKAADPAPREEPKAGGKGRRKQPRDVPTRRRGSK